jgi:hypothetical protein
MLLFSQTTKLFGLRFRPTQSLIASDQTLKNSICWSYGQTTTQDSDHATKVCGWPQHGIGLARDGRETAGTGRAAG